MSTNIKVSEKIASLLNMKSGEIQIVTEFPKESPCVRALSDDIKYGMRLVEHYSSQFTKDDIHTIVQCVESEWIKNYTSFFPYKDLLKDDVQFEKVRAMVTAIKQFEGISIACRRYLDLELVYPVLSITKK